MQLETCGFRVTVNRLTVQLVQDQTQIVQDRRGSTFHTVVDKTKVLSKERERTKRKFCPKRHDYLYNQGLLVWHQSENNLSGQVVSYVLPWVQCLCVHPTLHPRQPLLYDWERTFEDDIHCVGNFCLTPMYQRHGERLWIHQMSLVYWGLVCYMFLVLSRPSPMK